MLAAVACRAALAADPLAPPTSDPDVTYPFRSEVIAPASSGLPWSDFLLTNEVFDKAALDLGDLRLYDGQGKEVPYALRILAPRQLELPRVASPFNQVTLPDGTTEVSLDLGEDPPESNLLHINLPGANYRRHAVLEGSDDKEDWKMIGEKELFDFRARGQELRDAQIEYKPVRFRYFRLRVSQDPRVDDRPVPLEHDAIEVHYSVQEPGELVTQSVASTGSRDPVRTQAGPPGSAWIFDLGFDQAPIGRLEVDFADLEFNRTYQIAVAGPEGSDEPFNPVHTGQWSRHAGEPVQALVANFEEQRARRIRLTITDFANPPLSINAARYAGAARQIIVSGKEPLANPLKLYYGTPTIPAPHYDIERNLPAALVPPPERLVLGPRQANPQYVPPPKALTERWPALIYVVLGAACALLGLVILSLGRAAIAEHDARGQAEPARSG